MHIQSSIRFLTVGRKRRKKKREGGEDSKSAWPSFAAFPLMMRNACWKKKQEKTEKKENGMRAPATPLKQVPHLRSKEDERGGKREEKGIKDSSLK